MNDTMVEMTDTVVYRNIFLPVGVWYRRHRRFTVATIRANLAGTGRVVPSRACPALGSGQRRWRRATAPNHGALGLGRRSKVAWSTSTRPKVGP